MLRIVAGFVAGAMAAIAAIWIFPTTPRGNQPSPTQASCFSQDIGPDRTIQACSTLLAGKSSASQRAKALMARARAFTELNENQKAVEDLGTAAGTDVAVAPEAYTQMGIIKFKSGGPDAINDLDRAIKAKPDYAPAFKARADIFLGNGHFQ